MNRTLLKATAKTNWILGLIFFALMAFYMFMIVTLYRPESLAGMEDLMRMLPPELISMLGLRIIGDTLAGYLAGYYYGFLIILFPMIYTIIVSNRVIAKHVDKGSMSYLLSTPNSRLRVVSTQAAYVLISLTALITLIAVVGGIICESMFPGSLDIGQYALMNAGALLMFFAVSSICFFCSCFFNETKNSLAVGSGITIAFFLFQMIGNLGKDYAWIGKLSLFNIFDPAGIVAGDAGSILISFAAFAVIAIVLYGAAMAVFKKKNLPL